MVEKQPRQIQSVVRALNIIECFNFRNPALSLNEISDKMGLNKSTVHGLLVTLTRQGYIYNIGKGVYRLGFKLIEKGTLASGTIDLKELGTPFLNKISERYGEASSLTLFQNKELFLLCNVAAHHSNLIAAITRPGLILPLHASASGKLILSGMPVEERDSFLKSYKMQKLTDRTITNKKDLLADLERINKKGYSIEDEEFERDALTIAGPIHNHEGKIIAAISMTGPVGRMKKQKEQIGTDLHCMGKEISLHLGYSNPDL